ncbi:MAG: YSC84-related protein, partial [Xanthobacteraceae bacterium]
MRPRSKMPIVLLLAALFAAAAPATQSRAASGTQIEAGVHVTLAQFFRQVRSSRDLANKAIAVLVFPRVVKAGIGVGGEYGEGELLIRGQPAGFYNIASASVGFQLGAQARSVIIMFMTDSALGQFERTDGFKVGVDGSIAIIAIGAGGSIDTNSIT